MSTTVKEILIEWLKANGYTGIHSDECGCSIDDMAPCCCSGDNCLDCEPGYWREGWIEDEDEWMEGCFSTKEPTAAELKAKKEADDERGGER